jgi:hypothetical protein
MHAPPVASAEHTLGNDGSWEVVGQFLDALTRRDFGALETCLECDVRFRALVPCMPCEEGDFAAAMANFRSWFCVDEPVEFVDAAIGQVGTRMYLRWRAVRGVASDPDAFQVVEQHAFATVADRISVLEVLSSGFCPAGSAL